MLKFQGYSVSRNKIQSSSILIETETRKRERRRPSQGKVNIRLDFYGEQNLTVPPFVDFKCAYDSVDRRKLLNDLSELQLLDKIIVLIGTRLQETLMSIEVN